MRRFFLLLLLVVGCGVLSPEEQLLTDFFEAARLHDTTVLANISSVTFNPRTQGVVEQFEVEETRASADGQSRDVVILAQVRTFDGQVTPRRMRATMTRRDGRWFVADLRGPAGGGP